MKNIMPTTIHKTLLGTTMFAFAVLATTNLALAYPGCDVTKERMEDHIWPLHCNPKKHLDRNKFILDYWCDLGDAQDFCEMVQNSDPNGGDEQYDGRILYWADLNEPVGTEGEQCGVMVISSQVDGEVITQYPVEECPD